MGKFHVAYFIVESEFYFKACIHFFNTTLKISINMDSIALICLNIIPNIEYYKLYYFHIIVIGYIQIWYEKISGLLFYAFKIGLNNR